MATELSILIATPSYDGFLTIECVSSVLRLMELMKKTEPNVTFRDGARLRGRWLTMHATFLPVTFLSTVVTHTLLFVDADMGFSPATAKALNFVGSTAMMTEFLRASAGGKQPISAVKVEHGFVRVSYAGTGLMLIKREVFERLKERFPELWCSIAAQAQTYLGLSEGVLQCFSSFQDFERMFMGKIAFCRRWVDGCGGEACIIKQVTHVGRFAYTGCFADRLKQHQIS